MFLGWSVRAMTHTVLNMFVVFFFFQNLLHTEIFTALLSSYEMVGLLVSESVFVAIKWNKTGKKRMKRLLGPTHMPSTGNLLQLVEDPHIILTKSR